MLAVLGFVAVQAVWASRATVHPDSARYAALAWLYQGVPDPVTEQQAIALMCGSRDDPAACVAQQGGRLEPTTSPRYQAFFSTRPGYPLAAAALAPVLGGMTAALWAIPVGATALAGLVVAWLVHSAGAGPRPALLGQVLFYAAPTGWWGAQMLTEGPMLLGILITVAGCIVLARRELAVGTAVCTTGLLVSAAVKFSAAIALGAVLAAAALIAIRWAGASQLGLAAAAGLGASCSLTLLGVSQARGWPGISDTAQDIFTAHFAQPDVTNVAARLAEANHAYWLWFAVQPTTGLLAIGTAVGGWAMWRTDRALALFVVAAAATGLTVVAHPDPGQLDRLYLPFWLVATVGVPLASNTGPSKPKLPRRVRRLPSAAFTATV